VADCCCCRCCCWNDEIVVANSAEQIPPNGRIGGLTGALLYACGHTPCHCAAHCLLAAYRHAMRFSHSTLQISGYYTATSRRLKVQHRGARSYTRSSVLDAEQDFA
jgi:hypothetical protein